ncbi:MAG: hypothetical protein AAF487_09445 [Bacteroidota bacterium]
MKYKHLIMFFFAVWHFSAYAQSALYFSQFTNDKNCTNPFEFRERVRMQEIIDDSLVLVLGKRENCCANFVTEYTVHEDTLKIHYENQGENCFCTCFFDLTFKIPSRNLNFHSITFNDFQFDYSDQEYSVYSSTVDTLETGNILRQKFENQELILEVEETDTINVYREFYKGKLLHERMVKKKQF